MQNEKPFDAFHLGGVFSFLCDNNIVGTKWKAQFINWYINVSEQFFDVRLYSNFDYSLRLIAVILQEPLQTDLNSEFNSIFAEIGNTEAVSFDVNYVQLDRENLDASFENCEFLKNDMVFSSVGNAIISFPGVDICL